MNKSELNNLINLFKSNSTVKITKALTLNDLLYKDENSITLLEYMIMNDYEYHYTLVTGLRESIEAIKIICKYNKEDLLLGINTSTFLSNIDENQTLIEYLIDTKKIDNMKISSFKFDIKLMEIFQNKNRLDLISKVNISEKDLFLPDNTTFIKLLESNLIDYINFPEIIYHEEILDLLVKYNKTKLIEKISFSDNLLLNDKNNPLIKRILSYGYYPKIEHCSTKVLTYLYRINRADVLIKYFDNIDNIYSLFNYIDSNKKLTYIDYLLEFDKKEMSLNFKKLGVNACDRLDEVDYVNIYVKFSQYKKLDYLDTISKEELLKKNKKNHCLLDSFVFKDLNETFNILKYWGLHKDVDIIMYFKLNGIEISHEDVDLSMYDNEYSLKPIVKQTEEITDFADYEIIGEDNLYLLAELESVLSKNSDKELVEAITLFYSKELAKGNDSVLIEINKLIEIKKRHPEFVITKDNSAYFNHNSGLHLPNCEVNILSHELGHVFHYYLADDKTPFGFSELIENLRSDYRILNKVELYSKHMKQLEDSIYEKIENEFEKWSKDFYTNDKKDEIKEFIQSTKEEKIEQYLKLGYTREELELILDESYTLEQYMKCYKRVECNKKLSNVMAVSYSEVQAISDIIDAVYGGEYYNSRLQTSSGKTIGGTFGHGMFYYYSIDVVFQEIFANYCLLLKSEKRDESLYILKEIVGEDLIVMLDKFYNEEILNSTKYEKGNRTL